METTFSNIQAMTSETKNTSESKNSFIQSVYKNAEFNRFGIISGALILVGCMGGITVGMGAIASIYQLIPVVFSTMLTLAMILAVAPMKWIINLTLIALGLDILFLFMNLL